MPFDTDLQQSSQVEATTPVTNQVSEVVATIPEDDKTPAQLKNLELAHERRKKISQAAREILALIGVSPASGGQFEKSQWTFAWNVVNHRTRPDLRSKTAYSDDPLSVRVSRLLTQNLNKKESEKITIHDSYILISKLSGEESGNVRIIEVHYGAGETQKDTAFISDLVRDPREFLLKNNLPYKNTQIKICIHYPKDIPTSNKLTELLESSTNNEENESSVPISYVRQELPFNTKEVRDLDMEVDKQKNKQTVGRHSSEHFLEFREPSVRQFIEQVLKELPEESALSKLINIDKEFIVKHVYQSIKDNNAGNLDLAVGYVFEAAVAIEMRDGVNDDFLTETFWQKLNENRQDKGGGIDVTSDKAKDFYKAYREFSQKRGLRHADFIILEELQVTHPVTSEKTKRRVVSSLIECKVSNTEFLADYVKAQIAGQVGNLREFIEFFNKENPDDKVEFVDEKKTIVFVVKPLISKANSKPADRISSPLIVGSSKTYIIRSTVTTGDMEIARKNITPFVETETIEAAIVPKEN